MSSLRVFSLQTIMTFILEPLAYYQCFPRCLSYDPFSDWLIWIIIEAWWGESVQFLPGKEMSDVSYLMEHCKVISWSLTFILCLHIIKPLNILWNHDPRSCLSGEGHMLSGRLFLSASILLCKTSKMTKGMKMNFNNII